jgi:hypothetical protein
MMLREAAAERMATEGPPGSTIRVSFSLPKGGYATTVLAQVCELEDMSTGKRPAFQGIAAPSDQGEAPPVESPRPSDGDPSLCGECA